MSIHRMSVASLEVLDFSLFADCTAGVQRTGGETKNNTPEQPVGGCMS